MKKILIFIAFIAGAVQANAQLFGEKKVQNPAAVKRVNVWDEPRTDSLYYKGIVPDNMRVVLAYTFDYKPVYMLVFTPEYNRIVSYFKDSTQWEGLQSGELGGIEFGVTYLEKFSVLSKKQIKDLPKDRQIIAEAFNSSEKFLILAESPNYVRGTKDPRTGNISVVIDRNTNQPSQVSGSGQNQPAQQEVHGKQKTGETSIWTRPTPTNSRKRRG